MYNAILLLSVLAVLIIACYISHRHLKKTTEDLQTMIASNYACLDYLKEYAGKTDHALQNLINRHEIQTMMTKYNLAATRLQFLHYQQQAVQNDDFEGAAILANSISQIEKILEAGL